MSIMPPEGRSMMSSLVLSWGEVAESRVQPAGVEPTLDVTTRVLTDAVWFPPLDGADLGLSNRG